MNLNIYTLVGALALGLCSCSQTPHDPAPEDYDKLFPFGGISAAPESESVLPLRPCNPEQALADYKDLSNKNSAGRTVYEVSLVAAFYVRDASGALVSASDTQSKARISIRYIDDEGKIREAYTSTSQYPYGTYGFPDHVGEFRHLSNGEQFVANFTVHSGYPLYLSVDGQAERGTEVKASIRAVARDGSVIVPKLEVHQFQNNEGVDRLPQPYCNYIILP